MANDPLIGETIHIGGQTRTLLFNIAALRVCQRAYNGKTVRQLMEELDVDVVAVLASAGFMHENKRITPEKVAAWLENEPYLYNELATKVALGVAKGYQRLAPKEGADEVGEAMRAVEKQLTAPSDAGTDGPTSPASSA